MPHYCFRAYKYTRIQRYIKKYHFLSFAICSKMYITNFTPPPYRAPECSFLIQGGTNGGGAHHSTKRECVMSPLKKIMVIMYIMIE